MSLEQIRATYEALGRDDPLWAILTDDRYRGGKMSPEDFFATGRAEIAEVMDDLARHGVTPGRSAAVDFGCGVGRLTQALCDHFETAIGVDISQAMIDGAVRWNQHAARCRYVVNTTPTLETIADSSVDFVYSNISLQHSPPRYQAGYLREFIRILRPKGIAVFQVRIGPYRQPGSPAEAWYRLKSETLRPFFKRLRGRPPVQVHTISEREVEAVVRNASATLMYAAATDSVHRASRRSLRYTVCKA